jgi:hypothetical protein
LQAWAKTTAPSPSIASLNLIASIPETRTCLYPGRPRPLSRVLALFSIETASRWVHGAGGGAPRGNRNAVKHGEFAAETLALKREIQALARMARKTMAAIEEQCGTAHVRSASFP